MAHRQCPEKTEDFTCALQPIVRGAGARGNVIFPPWCRVLRILLIKVVTQEVSDPTDNSLSGVSLFWGKCGHTRAPIEK